MKTGKPSVVINVYGDNNKIDVHETHSRVSAVAVVLVLTAVAVLAVSFCCPKLLPDFVRCIISIVVNS